MNYAKVHMVQIEGHLALLDAMLKDGIISREEGQGLRINMWNRAKMACVQEVTAKELVAYFKILYDGEPDDEEYDLP